MFLNWSICEIISKICPSISEYVSNCLNWKKQSNHLPKSIIRQIFFLTGWSRKFDAILLFRVPVVLGAVLWSLLAITGHTSLKSFCKGKAWPTRGLGTAATTTWGNWTVFAMGGAKLVTPAKLWFIHMRNFISQFTQCFTWEIHKKLGQFATWKFFHLHTNTYILVLTFNLTFFFLSKETGKQFQKTILSKKPLNII